MLVHMLLVLGAPTVHTGQDRIIVMPTDTHSSVVFYRNWDTDYLWCVDAGITA